VNFTNRIKGTTTPKLAHFNKCSHDFLDNFHDSLNFWICTHFSSRFCANAMTAGKSLEIPAKPTSGVVADFGAVGLVNVEPDKDIYKDTVLYCT
jgi:hypothetical protein